MKNTAARGMTRRRWGAAAGATGAGVVVSACGAGGPSGGTGAGVQRTSTYTVRVQVWGDVQDQPVYDNIAADFNAAQEKIKIENDHQPKAAPGVPTYYEKFVTSLAGGTVSDVAYFQGWMWQEFALKDALQPLDEYGARDKWSTSWPKIEGWDTQTIFRGKRYLSPSNTGTQIFYYVKEYFDKAGVPYPKADWTVDQFQDLTRKLTRQIDGKQVFGYGAPGGFFTTVPWWRANGTLEWDRVAEPKKSLWNAAPVVEAFQWHIADSRNKLGITPPQELVSSDPNYFRLEFGGIAMAINGPWFLPQMWGPTAKRQGGTPFDVLPYPKGKSGKSVNNNLVEGQGMTKAGKDKDASWEVMKWIAGEQGQKRIVEGGRMANTPDMNRKLWLPEVKAKYNVANAEAFIIAGEKDSTIPLAGPITQNVFERETGMATLQTQVRDGKMTAKEALDEVQQKAQPMLDRYWAANPDK